MSDTNERCWLCSFWSGTRCTNTWRLVIHAEALGGQIDISTTPGMVPEKLKPRFTKFFQMFIDKLISAIEQFPIWDEIREFQMAQDKTNRECPGKNVAESLKPYLHVVRTPL